MNYPTGMGASTGLHYNRVAAQMQAYVNNSGGNNLYGAYGNLYQPALSRSAAMMSHVDPVVASDITGFGRKFMRHLIH